VKHRLGDLTLEARFVSEGSVTALFGRSGSGKTSLLNVIAGLIRPDEGHLRFGGAVLADAANGVFVPVHKRRFAYVFQDSRLFPHLTVRQNLLFGRWFAGRPGEPAEVDRIVDLLGVGPLLGRWPGSLSGGEKQRVAIGRALLARPRLLLMDEPLASLDEDRKDEILTYIERIRAATQVPIVYVSHAVAEVIRLASHVAILDRGKVIAFGPLPSMLSRIGPEGEAGFGEPSTLIEAIVAGHDRTFGIAHLDTALGRIDIARTGLDDRRAIRIRIMASDVMLATRRPEAISAQNVLQAVVADIRPSPDGLRRDVMMTAEAGGPVARITARAADQLGLAAGQPVFAIIKSVAIEI